MRRRAAARQGARAQPHDDRADQVLPLPRGAARTTTGASRVQAY